MYFLPCDFCLPCVFLLAHGKWTGCRVPEILHTVKIRAHDEVLGSGSESRSTWACDASFHGHTKTETA